METLSNCKFQVKSLQSNSVMTSIVERKYHGPAPEVFSSCGFIFCECFDHDSELHDTCINEEEKNFQAQETVTVIQW